MKNSVRGPNNYVHKLQPILHPPFYHYSELIIHTLYHLQNSTLFTFLFYAGEVKSFFDRLQQVCARSRCFPAIHCFNSREQKNRPRFLSVAKKSAAKIKRVKRRGSRHTPLGSMNRISPMPCGKGSCTCVQPMICFSCISSYSLHPPFLKIRKEMKP